MVSRKQKKIADEMLGTLHKVDCYRRDLLKPEELAELREAGAALVEEINTNDACLESDWEQRIQRLDRLLKKHGGTFYPKTFWAENVEVLLVAAIIVIGIRTFFFQPFIIPTNSMYPSYSGMRAVVYSAEEASPGVVEKGFRFVTRGARNHSVVAPVSGEVAIPLFSDAPGSPDIGRTERGLVRYRLVSGRKWFGLMPTILREYTLFVDGQPVRFRVPRDFAADHVVIQSFFPEVDDLQSFRTNLIERSVVHQRDPNPRLMTGHTADAGETVVQFDIELGDALFVDRLTYHFRRPRVGDPFVFRTGEISGLAAMSADGVVEDQYYIKRLAGTGGEVLKIENYALLVNGALRDENAAFRANAERAGDFPGYRNIGLFERGRRFTVPEGQFIALGDNSADSLDSRYFGGVPERSVIGRAIFIYYPFTRRWGVAD